MTELTQDYLNSILEYDPLSGQLKNKIYRSSRSVPGFVNKSVANNGYLRISIRYNRYLQHRVIWMMAYGEWPKYIDHVNGVRTDNRLCNLRNVEHFENSQNSKINIANTSGVLGVALHNRGPKWQAYINSNKKRKPLGLYSDWFEAVCARKSAEARIGYHENHGRRE